MVDCTERPCPSSVRAACIRSLFTSFAAVRGISDEPAALLDPDVVESFVVTGLPGRRSSTKGTYRSVLLNQATGRRWPREGHGTPFPGARAAAPYSMAERAELVAMARAQRRPEKRCSALALIALGIGAGLSHAELVALRGSDVSKKGSMLLVRVGGARPRTVAVAMAFARIVRELADGAGDDVVFRPGDADRSYKNFVADLALGTPIATLVEICGIADADSLVRYARHVEGAPRSKAELHARIAREKTAREQTAREQAARSKRR